MGDPEAAVSVDGPAERPGFEHLQWLCNKDQLVLCRSEFAAALGEESRLLAEMEKTILAHQRAIEHCRVVSETDPSWFTLDVQDCHARSATLLRDTVKELERTAVAMPDGMGVVDGLRGRIYSSYAQTAQATARAAAGLGETQQVQAAAATARLALDSLSTAFTSAAEQHAAGQEAEDQKEPTEQREPAGSWQH
eukprot:TRINITY_DN30361_c0_g1_i1.p1 TRINITY_DN30361_c0_g1~~TRINITY_DN30361_c0_g1_i1.p1  ORF type:complete len:205 (-),score=46.15 TRINITY_DN30361_c0_g1_i1:18-599(-)